MPNPLHRLLELLTREQKSALSELGISQQRRSDWAHDRRRPTLAQIMVLSMVAEVDPKPLVEWLAEQEATPSQLGYFRQVKTKRLGALLTAVFAVVLATPDPASAQCSSDQTRFDPLKSGNAHCRQLQDADKTLFRHTPPSPEPPQDS